MKSRKTVSQLIRQVLQQKHALTAPDLQELLARRGYTFNKTSIYRALDKMVEKQELCRHLFGGQTAKYEVRDHHHDHIVCLQCGRVESISCVSEPLDTFKNWQIDHHHLTLFGRCAHCLAQTETPDQLPTDRSQSERTRSKRSRTV